MEESINSELKCINCGNIDGKLYLARNTGGAIVCETCRDMLMDTFWNAFNGHEVQPERLSEKTPKGDAIV